MLGSGRAVSTTLSRSLETVTSLPFISVTVMESEEVLSEESVAEALSPDEVLSSSDASGASDDSAVTAVVSADVAFGTSVPA